MFLLLFYVLLFVSKTFHVSCFFFSVWCCHTNISARSKGRSSMSCDKGLKCDQKLSLFEDRSRSSFWYHWNPSWLNRWFSAQANSSWTWLSLALLTTCPSISLEIVIFKSITMPAWRIRISKNTKHSIIAFLVILVSKIKILFYEYYDYFQFYPILSIITSEDRYICEVLIRIVTVFA